MCVLKSVHLTHFKALFVTLSYFFFQFHCFATGHSREVDISNNVAILTMEYLFLTDTEVALIISCIRDKNQDLWGQLRTLRMLTNIKCVLLDSTTKHSESNYMNNNVCFKFSVSNLFHPKCPIELKAKQSAYLNNTVKLWERAVFLPIFKGTLSKDTITL